MDTQEAIITRRSIRHYTADPVGDATLDKVLEAARWAPSWANVQPCRYIVVRDSAAKERLAEMAGKNPSTQAIRTAPVVIVACAELGVSGFYDGQAMSDEGDWHMYDTGVAMQNLALAAHALGLGTVHVGLNFDTKRAAEILGIPDTFRAVVMTPLGYPARTGNAPPRKELSELAFAEKWGQGR